MALRPAVREIDLSFSVDDVTYEVTAWTDMTALHVLRDVARHPGTRWRCEAGLCGSSAATLDGAPTRLCSIGAGRLAGARVQLPVEPAGT